MSRPEAAKIKPNGSSSGLVVAALILTSIVAIQAPSTTADLTSIPFVQLVVADDPAERQRIVAELCQVANHSVLDDVIKSLVETLSILFNLTNKANDKVALHNSLQLLGYSRASAETIAGKSDYREQFEFATEVGDDWWIGNHLAERLKGANQAGLPKSTSAQIF